MTGLVETLVYILLVSSMAFALVGLVLRAHPLNKIIVYSMFSDVVCVAIVFIGYRVIAEPPKPPIMPIVGGENMEIVVEKAVDPLVQCLVLTAFVIGLASLILMTFLTLIPREEEEEGAEASR